MSIATHLVLLHFLPEKLKLLVVISKTSSVVSFEASFLKTVLDIFFFLEDRIHSHFCLSVPTFHELSRNDLSSRVGFFVLYTLVSIISVVETVRFLAPSQHLRGSRDLGPVLVWLSFKFSVLTERLQTEVFPDRMPFLTFTLLLFARFGPAASSS